MKPSSVVDFDPYQAWLRVQHPNRPLNAYQLLGLKDLESDPAKIRAAFDRQLVALGRCQAGADEGLWSVVSGEVDVAYRTLLDPELKAVLDGGLRRSQPISSNERQSRAEAHGNGGEIKCRSCGNCSGEARRFCGSCGGSLWEKCPQCGAECACDERFCGHCGFDIHSGVEQRNRDYRQQLEQAQQLAAGYHYERALSQLRKLAAIDDKRFECWAQLALEEIDRTNQQAATAQAQTGHSLATARQLISEYAYDKAADALTSVPEPLRSDELKELLQKAHDARSELASLNSQIRQMVSQKALWSLLPLILRVLALKPDDAPVQKLALQLRDHFVKLAKAKLAAHEYAEAGKALQQIAPFARTQEVELLSDKALELDSLRQDLQRTAIAGGAALALGRKLIRYAPSDQAAQKLLAKLEQRANSPAADPRLAAPNGDLPARTHVGMPVDWLGRFTSVDIASPEISRTLQQRPGQFFVALGLALQGLDEAQILIDLAFQENAGLLGKLNFSRLRAKPTSAWGLDLGNFGLRALKLHRDPRSGHLQVERCEFIPHELPLTAPSAELERSNLLEQTLKAFRAECKTEGSKVVVNLSGQRVLGRFFELPPLPAAKVADAVQFEARHQLPIALDELSWGYHTLSQGDGKSDSRGANVVLTAVRRSQVREFLAPFRSVGIGVDLVQSDCVALHNAVHREFFVGRTNDAEDAAPSASFKNPKTLGEQDSLAFIDVGADGTSVVISSSRATWFRSFGVGGSSFTNALVKELQLTFEQAEQWKQEPAKAHRFHQYQGALQPLFAQLTSEIERSVASYQKLYPNHKIRHLYGVGGAFATHGLLRQLRFGP